MSTLRVEAPAKVNLAVTIEGRRDDGYHELRTVLQAVEWVDGLTFRRRPDGFRLEVSDPSVPSDERNLVAKAWSEISRVSGLSGGLEVQLEKRIPHGAGLGGGSSDAAATLLAVNDLYELGLTVGELERIAADLGSDVPFFLRGGTQLGTGRGENLEPISPLTVGAFLVASPSVRLSTRSVYEAGGFELTPSEDPLSLLRLGIAREDPEGVAHGLFNALEGPAFSLRPELKRLKGQLLATPALGALLCGSGSSVFAFFRDDHDARSRAREIDGVVTRVVSPRPDGVRRVE